MKKTMLLFVLFFSVLPIFGQDNFYFTKKRNKISFSFQLVNNLVCFPIVVNGIKMNFLLDTGVEHAILFSLEDLNKNIEFENAEKIKIRGLGSKTWVDGLKSINNNIEIKGLVANSHVIYVVLDQEFNLSSHMGIPINGMIGFSFFKDYLVKIDYQNRKINIFQHNEKKFKRIFHNYIKVPISIENSKPYVQADVSLNNIKIPVKLLVDIGNSDSVWLFQNKKNNIIVPKVSFEDYLGKGFSGEIFGERAKIEQFQIADYKIKNPIVAFPDSLAIKELKLIPGRMGSVGGAILSRFTVIMDYKNQNLYLAKNIFFDDPFTYNRSGIEISQSGFQLMEIKRESNEIPIKVVYSDIGNAKSSSKIKYSYDLKPIYEISNLRKNSPASNSGLQEGDIILAINGRSVNNYSLEKTNEILKSVNKKWIEIQIQREGEILNFKFELISIFD